MWFVGNTVSGFVVKKPRGLTMNGIQYPKNIFTLWSKDELANIGIKPYSIAPFDDRYYDQGALTRTEVDGEVRGEFSNIEKDVAPVKQRMLKEVRGIMALEQSRIDWYWSRASKIGTPVPEDIQAHARALYATLETKEAEIDALATIADVLEYQNTPMVGTYLKQVTDKDGNHIAWGPETYIWNQVLNLVRHGWPVLGGEASESLVSLV